MAIKKTGCIIGVREGMLDTYIRLHDEQPDEERALMKEHGFLKCEIFVKELAGKTYLFQYNEVDTSKDNDGIYKSPVYQQWLKITGACQEPLPGEQFWQDLPQVYALNKNE